MSGKIIKRSLTLKGHKTSISLEDDFFTELKSISAARDTTMSEYVALIETSIPPGGNLSSAVRCEILARHKAAIRRAHDEASVLLGMIEAGGEDVLRRVQKRAAALQKALVVA